MQIDCEKKCAQILVRATESLAPVLQRVGARESAFVIEDGKV